MGACRRNLQGALYVFLPLDVRKIRIGCAVFLRHPGADRLHGMDARQMIAELPYGFRCIDGDISRQSCLRSVFLRHYDSVDPRLFCREHHGQHAGHRAQFTAHAQLTQKRPILPRQPQLPRRRQNSQQNGQIIDRAGFFRAGWGKVHGNSCGWKFKPRAGNGSPDPLPGFLYRRIRKAYDIKARKSRCNAALHLHQISGDSCQSH